MSGFGSRLLAGLLLAVVGACAAPDALSREGGGAVPDRGAPPVPTTGTAPGSGAVAEPGAGVRADVPAVAPPTGAGESGTDQEAYAPSILRPAAESTDPALAEIGGIEIRKRHVFDRLFEIEPRRARQLLVDLENDVRVMVAAQHHAIRVDPARVEQRAGRSEAALRAQLERELDDGTTFEGYLRRQKDLALDEYRRLLRLSFARQLYREYVVRYLALREERVKVRILAHDDRKLMDELAGKVRAGADFATLAVRHSQDITRRDGGLLPPFSRGFEHPVAEVAFSLQPGELSNVLEVHREEQARYYLVYLVERLPGRALPFAAVRSELDEAIAAGALSAFEVDMIYDRLRRRGPGERVLQAPVNSGGNSR